MQRYSKEFREEAISLSDEIGPKKAAQQLGINYATLIDWRKKRKTKTEKEKSTVEPKTVEELQKEIAELKKANDILKDALGFFALDRKK
jgi:transposase